MFDTIARLQAAIASSPDILRHASRSSAFDETANKIQKARMNIANATERGVVIVRLPFRINEEGSNCIQVSTWKFTAEPTPNIHDFSLEIHCLVLLHIARVGHSQYSSGAACPEVFLSKLNEAPMAGLRCTIFAAPLITFMLSGMSALAQTSEQIGWCTGVLASYEEKIEGCTAMITSRKYKGEQLAGLYNRRGIAYVSLKKYDQAIDDYNQSLLHDISNTDVMYNRGLAYTRKGDFQQAIADFNRALKGFNAARYPEYYKRDYLKARGNAYRGKQNFDLAIADYSEAIQLDADFARAWFNRGELRRKLGDTARGDDDIARAKQLQSDIESDE